ncbi:MAG: RIP metalloprotease RseP [Spirochaetales bacterium]|nr:RIP metalloprotease RseP [Spirochaetales bacterium]
MIIVNILLGLLGLGIVILVHELGHFIAAKASGIQVEAFSIGWGKVLFAKTFRGTQYRLSLLPIGGYCKMKGEEFFKQASGENDGISAVAQPGSLFSVAPIRRAITYLSGPLANLLFSILVLSVIWMAGFAVTTFSNKIILLSETALADQSVYPADQAGLQTGDIIVEIDGDIIENFRDIEQHVTPSGGRELQIVVSRNGRLLQMSITPLLDTETGAGRIGVGAWVDPIVASAVEGTAAQKAGILAGDYVTKINGTEIQNSLDLYDILTGLPDSLYMTVERAGVSIEIRVPVTYSEDGNVDLGFAFETMVYLQREANPIAAFIRGIEETFSTLVLTVRSIGLLFRGVNVRNAVSGPIRITYLVGEVASQGFNQGIGRGLIILFRFLSMLSVALCFMNLLPIPALDGGFILITVSEMLARKPVRPKFFYRYQIVGFAIIFAILILTLFNDVFFLINQ